MQHVQRGTHASMYTHICLYIYIYNIEYIIYNIYLSLLNAYMVGLTQLRNICLIPKHSDKTLKHPFTLSLHSLYPAHTHTNTRSDTHAPVQKPHSYNIHTTHFTNNPQIFMFNQRLGSR